MFWINPLLPALLSLFLVAFLPTAQAGSSSSDSNVLSVDTRDSGALPPEGDFDGDGCPNGAECMAGTDPRDASSLFVVGERSAAPNGGGTGTIFTVNWASVAGRTYRVERSTTLAGWTVVADDVAATPPTNTLPDEVEPSPERMFYRILVK